MTNYTNFRSTIRRQYWRGWTDGVLQMLVLLAVILGVLKVAHVI